MWRRLFQQHSLARLLSRLFQPGLRLSALSICAQEHQHAMSADPCQISALYAFQNTPTRISHDYDHSIASNTSPDSASNSRAPRRSATSSSGGAQSKSPMGGSRFWKRRSSVVLLDAATDGEGEQVTTQSVSTNDTKDVATQDRDESPSGSAFLATPRPQSTLQRPTSSYLDIDKDLPQLPERPLPPLVANNSAADSEPGSSASATAGPSGPSRRMPSRPMRVTSSSNTQPRRSSIAFADPDPPRQAKDASITFASPSDSVSTSPSAKTPVSVRRSRSVFTDGKAYSDTEEVESRVKRRLSVGAALFGDGKGKGKEKEVEATQTDGEEKSLSRKSSFWSRRRRKDSTPASTRPSATVAAEPPLPVQTAAMERGPSSASYISRRRSNSHSVLDPSSPSSSTAPSLPPLSFATESPDFLSPESSINPPSSNNFTSKNSGTRKFSGGLFSRPSSSKERTTPDGTRPSTASASAAASPRQSLELSHPMRKSYTPSRSSSILRRSDDALASKTTDLGTSSQDLSSAPPSATGWNSYNHGVTREGQPSRFVSKTSHERRSESTHAGTRRRTMSLRHPDGSLTQLSIPAPPLPNGANLDMGLLTPSTSDLGTPFSASGYVTVTRTPSLASVSDASHSSSRQSHPQARMTRNGRARASTTAGPLSATSPTLLHRLSQHFFPSSNSSVTSASNFSSNNASSTMLSLPASNGKPVLSRRNSTAEGSATASASTFGHVAPVSLASSVTVPKPKVEEETPEKYLARLVQAVSKAEIASVLASSSDDFHTRALRAYLARFDFTVDPLDVALRKLLMDLSLPKETQQIDRVMEAFAKRYEECNPGLFISDDHPYILAFSLMMLHTDAFNKSNKRKMTKADYVRNTRLPGVPSEVLDCFFDNITFAPFIFIEDPVDVNGQRGFVPEGTPVLSGMTTFGGSSGASPAVGVGGTSMFGQVKIDPYYLITQRLLVPLRKEVEIEIPEQNPFLYTGTAARWDEAKLQRAFAEAESVEIANPTPPRRRGSVLTLSIGNDSANADDDFDREQSIVLKVTKLGVLNRKEDLLEGGKRSSNRKWKEWSVLLTGSQLLFFKDLNLAQSIMELPTPTAAAPGNSAPRYRLPASPDEAMSVKDSVALFDTGYRKYPHAFRMLMPGGRQYLLHAPDEHSMNEWMALINYASTFKTAGLRMRPSAMTNGQLQQVGIAAATSWVNEVRRKRLVSLPSRQPKTPTARASTGDLPLRGDVSDDPDRTLYSSSGTLNASTVSLGGPLSIKRKAAPSVELEAPPLETADGRLEDTFFEVKAQLAVMPPETRKSVLLRTPNPNHRPVTRAVSLGIFPPDDEQRQRVSSDEPLSPHSRGLHRGSRNLVIGAKIKELEAKLSSAQYSLDSDVRIARNFAVLTPFLRSTRERLIPAIAPLAKRIRTMRMQVAMLICHRDILYADMAAEDREWRGTMDVALSAGAEFLKQKEEVQNEIPGLPSPLSSSLPRMTLSDFSGRGTPDGGATSNPMSPTVQTYGEAGRPSSEDNRTSSSSDGSSGDPVQALAKPSPPRNDPSEQEPRVSDEIDKAKEKTEDTPKETDLETRASDAGSERCEEWNKTKAAKRVSLAQLPSDRKLSALTLLSRHTGATGVNPTTVHEDDKPN